MNLMLITRDRLNPQALACEEAQNRIRIAVKDATLSRKPKAELDKIVRQIILACLSRLSSKDLKNAAYRSLVAFYNTEQRIIRERLSGDRLLLFLALTKLVEYRRVKREDKVPYTLNMTVKEAREIIEDTAFIPDRDKEEILNFGNALNKYHEDYIKHDVSPVLERMAREEALDPDSEEYLGQRSTLRNRAEREVRWQAHIDEIEGFKARGVKLVIASAHANCSPRCSPWQGRVYSLDGTYGTTDDGREYEPLENATKIPTKNGRWYNGLLGFNCRHYLVEYKSGYKFPEVSLATEGREYAIEQKQRYFERQVRKWRAEAEMQRGTGDPRYRVAERKAREWNQRYIAFSKANQRAYYTSRTRLL
jgi:hypothetical protein